MPLKWTLNRAPRASVPAEPPLYVLAAPGSIRTLPGAHGPLTPGRRVTQALAAGSLLAVAAQPYRGPWPAPVPRPLASTFTVLNLNPAGAGSLSQAVQAANAHPGPDTIAFNGGLTGTITLTNTLIVSDTLLIQGPGPGQLSVSGGSTLRIFYLTSSGTVPFTTTISGLTLRDGHANKNGGGAIWATSANLILDQVDLVDNWAGNNGGGIYFSPPYTLPVGLTVRDSLITGNVARSGGGIYLYSTNTDLTIQNTRIISNATTTGFGGGVYLYTDRNLLIEDSSFISNTAGAGARGGALFIRAADTAVIRRTTLSGNTAAIGGGLFLYGSSSRLTLENSTVSGNQASNRAGGVFLYYGTRVHIQNSTIVSNSAANGAGGVEVLFQSLTMTDSIVAGNLAPVNADISGTFQLRYDLVQITGTANISDAGGNLFGLDPLLGPLADNGGPTPTHLPRRNSPVINAGDPAFVEPPSTDQRGEPRQTGRLDLGAVEVVERIFLPLIRR